MEHTDRDPFVAAIFEAVGDAQLNGTCTEATDYSGCEVIIRTDCPAQAKVIVLIARDSAGRNVQLTVRSFMFRQLDKRTSISDRGEFGARRFSPDHISLDWLRHRIALAARDAQRMCSPEHQAKLRQAAMQQQRKR